MIKYQNVFVDQLKRTRNRWDASGSGVAERELYRYLHSVKGTAATIGLAEWSEQAAGLLPRLQEEGERIWSLSEVDQFLAPIYALYESFPMNGMSPGQEQTIQGNEMIEEETEPSTARAFVLLIDDDVALLQLLKERLEAAGYMVMATPSPDKGERWLDELKPDCVVLDVVLPGMSGFELISRFRRHPAGGLVPIMLMSAQTDRSARFRAYASDGDDFVTKPVDPDELIARVDQRIRRKRAVDEQLARIRTVVTVHEKPSEEIGGWNVAVIDDDPIIRSMMKRRLELMTRPERQLDIRVYEDGQSFFADDWHRRDGRYLVLLDRMMPRMNGIEVLSRLRSEYPPERYRILMLTGVGEEREIAQALRIGTDDYVTKPFRLPELEARIDRLLQGKGR